MARFEPTHFFVGDSCDNLEDLMKVAIVFEIFYPIINGIITSSVNLSRNLIEQGHEVVFIAPETDEFSEPYVEDGRIPVYYIQSSRNWAYPGMRNVLPWNKRVQIILRQERVDVVHITGPFLLTWAAMRGARNLSLPVVHTFHTMLFHKTYIIYMFKYHFLVPFLQDIAWHYFALFVRRSIINTAPTVYVTERLKQQFPKADVRHITNGVDVEQFTDAPPVEELQERYPMHNEKTILFVGRLGDEKSVDELIRAMPLVLREVPDARLLLVGDGPGADSYKRLTKELELEQSVVFLGRIPHDQLIKSGLVQHSRLFATASTTETQGITVIEAILCDVPVVVPDVPGITELVEGNGLRFRAHDISGLAAQIVRLLTDDELHQRCAAGSNELKSRFDGRQVTREFVAVYSEAVKRQKERQRRMRHAPSR